MKSRLFLLLLTIPFFIAACGGANTENGENGDGDSESEKPEFFIQIGDHMAGKPGIKRINYMSDYTRDVTTFKIDSTILTLRGGFGIERKNDPMSVKGKSYPGSIQFEGKEVAGNATIDNVEESEKDERSVKHKMKGTFTGEGGEKGEFVVSATTFIRD